MEMPRVELPSVVAQSEQAARMGGGRATASDTVQRESSAYELELLSRKRSEEVQAAERVDGRQHGDGGERARDQEHHHPDDDDAQRHIDLTA